MKGVFQNLIGYKSGRLTVIGGPVKHKSAKGAHWECLCECGEKTKSYIPSSAILRQTTKSCGCLMVEGVKLANSTHKMTLTPTYIAWKLMWQRCTNPKHKSYPEYKSRAPVARWGAFESFFEDMGRRPNGMSLDRIDNSLGYSPENCRWADAYTQQGNTKRNIYLKVNGEKMCLKAACRLIGFPYHRAKRRVSSGYSVVDALTKECKLQKNNVGNTSFDLSKYSLAECEALS